METIVRKPFQGITNIIRFNWPFYVTALLFVTLLLLALPYVKTLLSYLFLVIAFGTFFLTMISLMVSLYVYDLSGLYSLHWLDEVKISSAATLVNIHAGFDETSALLVTRYSGSPLLVLDFYDPQKHTEPSIKRARKKYQSYPGTVQVTASSLPLAPASIDVIFCLLAAHEIRSADERTAFFFQLRKSLKTGGKIIFIEHLRDISNFVAYTIGFFHFYSKKTWERHFKQCEFVITKEFTITPFITGYILQHGTAP